MWLLSSEHLNIGRLLLVGIPIAVAAALLAGSVAYELSSRQEPRYEASSLILLSDLDSASTTGSVAAAPDQSVIPTETRLVTTRQVIEAVANRSDITENAGDIAGRVTASTQGKTSLVRVTATAGSGTRAAAIANAVAEEYVSLRRSQARSRSRRSVRALQRQYSRLTAETRQSNVGLQLSDRIESLELVGRVGPGTPRVAETADPPEEPISPQPRRDAQLAGLFGLVLGLGLAVGLVQTDRRLRRPEQVGAALGLPVLAALPHLRRRGLRQVRERDARGYRFLYRNLVRRRLLDSNGATRGSSQRPLSSVAVVDVENLATGAAVAEQLALAAAHSGERVLLALADSGQLPAGAIPAGDGDGDPRAGTLKFSTESDRDRSLSLLPPKERNGRGASVDHRRLVELVPPSEKLCDLVVFPAPAPAEAPDAIALLERAEGIVLSVRLGHTESTRLAGVREQFESLGLIPLGVVVLKR